MKTPLLKIVCGLIFVTSFEPNLDRCSWIGTSSACGGTVSFFDDFLDGDILDGVPISWDVRWRTPNISLSDQGLTLTNGQSAGSSTSGLGPDIPISGNLSIRAQVVVERGTVGITTRFGTGPAGNENDGYFLQLNASGSLTGSYRANNVLNEAASAMVKPAAGTGKNFWLQLDMRDERVEGWYWEVGSLPPTSPQISFAQADEPTSGLMGLYVTDGIATFRSVQVETTHIVVPEPHGLLIGVTGLVPLIGSVFDRKCSGRTRPPLRPRMFRWNDLPTPSHESRSLKTT